MVLGMAKAAQTKVEVKAVKVDLGAEARVALASSGQAQSHK